MGARVTVEERVFSDPRFAITAANVGINSDEVVGKMCRIWLYCTERQTYYITEKIFKSLIPLEGFFEACLESGLLKRKRKQIYVSGTEGKIEWLGRLRQNSKRGGEANKLKTEEKRRLKQSQKASLQDSHLASQQASHLDSQKASLPIPIPTPIPINLSERTETKRSGIDKRWEKIILEILKDNPQDGPLVKAAIETMENSKRDLYGNEIKTSVLCIFEKTPWPAIKNAFLQKQQSDKELEEKEAKRIENEKLLAAIRSQAPPVDQLSASKQDIDNMMSTFFRSMPQ